MLKSKKLLNFIFSLLFVYLIFLFTSCTAVGFLGGVVTNEYIPDSVKIPENEFSTIKKGTNCIIKLVNNNNLSGSFEGLRYIPGTTIQNHIELSHPSINFPERGDSITLELRKIKNYKGVFLGIESNYLNILQFDKKHRIPLEYIVTLKDNSGKIITGVEIRDYYKEDNLALMDYKVIINIQNSMQEIARTDIDYIEIKRDTYFQWIGAGAGLIIDIIVLSNAELPIGNVGGTSR